MFYHTFQHVEKMLKDLDEISEELDLSQDEYFMLYIAICFHDIVYDPYSLKNEENSANLFEEKFKNIESSDFVKKVKKLILSTKVDFQPTDDKLEQIIHTLDWNGFTDYYTMEENRKKIFFEACSKKFEPITILENQIKFYYSIIFNMENRNYKIDYFNEKKNQQALKNLKEIVLQRVF